MSNIKKNEIKNNIQDDVQEIESYWPVCSIFKKKVSKIFEKALEAVEKMDSKTKH